jgi:hypothetical protein
MATAHGVLYKPGVTRLDECLEEMMKVTTGILSAALVASAITLAAPVSRADVDISFGARTTIGDDSSLYFDISSRYFNQDQRFVRDWGQRFRNPDDLAVFMYIVQRANESPHRVYQLRRAGMSWYDVGVRCGIPFNAWYVTVNGTPRGRYSRPYGYYNQHRRNPTYVRRLSDREIRDLVAVRMAHEYYGVSPETAMDWRRNGSNVQIIMTREYRNRHHGDHDRDRYDRDHDDRNRDRDDYRNNRDDGGNDNRR